MRKYTALLLSIIIPHVLFGFGTICGTVTDQKSGTALTAVSIQLLEPGADEVQMGTLSGPDGTYRLEEVPPGSYRLAVDYLGYEKKEIKEVTVTRNATVLLDIALSATTNNELATVVVRSKIKRTSINALYTLQQKAGVVSDGIAAEAIKKSPDGNAGEVLKRMSGATIQDHKFVVIRGLNNRYNTALVDGAQMPSTEANRKAFSFDMIPSGMIDNLIIYKSATPDMPGDFSGGAINIHTKEVPEENFNTLSVSTGFETTATGTTFRSGYRGATEFLGFTAGNRSLPEGFPSQSQINQHPRQSIENLGLLHNDYAIREHTALPPLSLSLGAGRHYYVKGNRQIGVTAAAQYAHTESIQKNVLRQYDNYDYNDNIYHYGSRLGALLNFGYRSERSKISLKSFYNRILDDQLLERDGINYSSSGQVRYYAFDLMEKSLFKTTLSGRHTIGSEEKALHWLLSYNYITNKRPDQRKVSYTRPVDEAEAPYIADITSLGKANNRLFSHLGETIVNGGLNYERPLALFEKTIVKAGINGQYRHRDFYNRYLGAVLDPMFPNGNAIRQLPIDRIFSQETILTGPYFLEDQTLDADEYHATARTIAGFLMFDHHFTSSLRAIWGGRVEKYHIQIATGSRSVAKKNWIDFLPSLNLTYVLNDHMNLRAAYFKSVARPEFREMTNLPYYDYELSATMSGNPDLERSRIHNLDLRFEWFPRPGEIISATVFYKRFINAIESRVYGANSSYDITPFNSPLAKNFGAEIEIRKNLAFLKGPSFLDQMDFYLNIAWIESSAATDKLFVRGAELNRRPLSGQAPYVINSGLGYHSHNGKLSMNILFNRIGQRLTFIGQDRMGLIYESPRNLLDFQIRYALNTKSSFRLSAKNILNAPVQFYFDQNTDGRFNGSAFDGKTITDGQDWIWKSYTPGTSFSLTYELTI